MCTVRPGEKWRVRRLRLARRGSSSDALVNMEPVLAAARLCSDDGRPVLQARACTTEVDVALLVVSVLHHVCCNDTVMFEMLLVRPLSPLSEVRNPLQEPIVRIANAGSAGWSCVQNGI